MSRRDYYDRAESWAADMRAETARSRRIAWTVAGVAVGVAALEAFALAMLLPLKTVQPVTLLVDRQTGYVQALNPLEPRRVGADAALTQSYLAQYVTAREGFDRATVPVDYRRVALWSTGRARSEYLARMPATNPESPFQIYPAGTVVAVRVKSVSRLDQGVALVRFDAQVQDRNGRVGEAQPWISVVRYRYVDAPMRLEDRLVNPLGFQVTGYRRDAEAPPPRSAEVRPLAAAAPVPAPAPAAVVQVVQAEPVAATAVARPDPVRDVRRPARVASPTPRPGYREPRADVALLRAREVPLSNLPLGSPLTPPAVPVQADPR